MHADDPDRRGPPGARRDRNGRGRAPARVRSTPPATCGAARAPRRTAEASARGGRSCSGRRAAAGHTSCAQHRGARRSPRTARQPGSVEQCASPTCPCRGSQNLASRWCDDDDGDRRRRSCSPERPVPRGADRRRRRPARPGARAPPDAGLRHPLADATYASALLTPPVILAIGLNYAAHSSELGLKTDSTPTVFVLWPNSLAGHDATTTWPRSLSESVDYEAELGVIIGTPAKDVSPEDALCARVGLHGRQRHHGARHPVLRSAVVALQVVRRLHPDRPVRGHGRRDRRPAGPAHLDRAGRAAPCRTPRPTRWCGRSRRSSRTCRSRRRCCPARSSRPGSPGGAGYSRDPQVFLRDRSTVTVGIDGIGALTTHCRILD